MMRPNFQLAGRFGVLALLAGSLTGCQSIAGISQYAQVRVIDTSPDAPSLDVYQNGAAELYNVGFGTVSSYIPMAAGAYTYTGNASGTQQVLASVHGTLVPGGQYTVLAGNTSAALQFTLLKDQATAAPAGRIALRIIDQATRAGAVDVYLVPSTGSLATTAPTLNKLSFGNVPVYLDVPSGTYSVVVQPASGSAAMVTPDAVPALYAGNQVGYPGTAARTVVLLDGPVTSAFGVQVVTVEDFEPAAK